MGCALSSAPGPTPHLHHQVCPLQSCDLLQFHCLPIEEVDYQGGGVCCTIPRSKLCSQDEVLEQGTISYLGEEGDWTGREGGSSQLAIGRTEVWANGITRHKVIKVWRDGVACV